MQTTGPLRVSDHLFVNNQLDLLPFIGCHLLNFIVILPLESPSSEFVCSLSQKYGRRSCEDHANVYFILLKNSKQLDSSYSFDQLVYQCSLLCWNMHVEKTV